MFQLGRCKQKREKGRLKEGSLKKKNQGNKKVWCLTGCPITQAIAQVAAEAAKAVVYAMALAVGENNSRARRDPTLT